MIFSVFIFNSLFFCYPAKSSFFVSLSIQPNEGKLETKTPISQAIRLLFCVLYSSSESHTNSYYFLLNLSFALHLFFNVFFPLFFSGRTWSVISGIHCNVFFSFKKLFIIPCGGFFFQFICYLSLLLHLSFRLCLCHFISFVRSLPHHPSRLVWPVLLHCSSMLFCLSFSFSIFCCVLFSFIKLSLQFSPS